MSSRVRVRRTGYSIRLTDLQRHQQQRIRRGLVRLGPPLLRTARRRAPVATGRLRRGLHLQGPRRRGQTLRLDIGWRAHYTPYQEYGTRRGLRPRRFIVRAVRQYAPLVRRLVADAEATPPRRRFGFPLAALVAAAAQLVPGADESAA